MALRKRDLIPYPIPAKEETMFWEIAEIHGTGDDQVVKLIPRQERPATTAPKELASATVVPVALLRGVRVFRETDPFAEDALEVDSTVARDFDTLGTNPRAWAKAFLQKHGPGREAADETHLLGWFARLMDAGAARERAINPVRPKPRREPTRTKPMPLKKSRRV